MDQAPEGTAPEAPWPAAPLGFGVGLRTQFYPHLLEHPPTGVGWFEIISENFFGAGGRPRAVLEKVRQDVPVVMHGVSMAIGNRARVPDSYIRSLKTLIEQIEPAWVSDHLCWGGVGGHSSHDLLPLPHNEETLEHVVRNVLDVQERLGRRILIENVSTYVRFRDDEMDEPTFLLELVQRADCGILLDINNVLVNAHNHGCSATAFLDAIPIDRVGQFHLSGHDVKGRLLIDTHICPVPENVWALYRHALARFGPVPTLLEWDEDVPDYHVVVAESARAAAIADEVLRQPQPVATSTEVA